MRTLSLPSKNPLILLTLSLFSLSSFSLVYLSPYRLSLVASSSSSSLGSMVRSNNDGNHDNSKSNDKNKNKNKNNNSMSLASYLRSSRSSLSSPSPSAPYNVVTGNQAADMDSIVSTIVLGYYLEVLRRHRGDDKNENADNADNADADNALHIPLLPLPSSSLRLRPDVLSLFSLLLNPLSPPPPRNASARPLWLESCKFITFSVFLRKKVYLPLNLISWSCCLAVAPVQKPYKNIS